MTHNGPGPVWSQTNYTGKHQKTKKEMAAQKRMAEISNIDHGMEIIPTHPLSKTECGRVWSHAGCQFGKNWNTFKENKFAVKL